MFDFASDGRAEGDHLGINDKGLVTYDRKSEEGCVLFLQGKLVERAGDLYYGPAIHAAQHCGCGPVKVYSNCDFVELKLNGVSLGTVPGDDCVFVWPQVTLARGQNRIEATGTRGGQSYADAITIEYDPGAIPVRPLDSATRPSTRPHMP